MPAKLDGMEIQYNNNKWQMRLNQGNWQDPPYPELVVGKEEVGVFTFKIVGSGDVVFHSTDPFIEKSSSQPGGPKDFKDQFIVLGKGTKDLTVIDVNGLKNGQGYGGGTYNYALQFTGAPALDPIITNMGCCRSTVAFSTGEAVVYSLVLAGAGALAMLGLRKLLAKPSPVAAGVARKDQ
jgi:hypothetical protein